MTEHMDQLKRNMCIRCCDKGLEDIKKKLNGELVRYHLTETIINLAQQVHELDTQLADGRKDKTEAPKEDSSLRLRLEQAQKSAESGSEPGLANRLKELLEQPDK